MQLTRVCWINLKKGLTALGAVGLLSGVVAQGGTTSTVTPRPGNLPNAPSFPLGMTPDGSKLLFMSYATNIAGVDPDGQVMDLFIYDVPERSIRRLSDNTPSQVFTGAISPNGRYVTFATSASGDYRAYLMDVQTGEILREIQSAQFVACAVSDDGWVYQLEYQLWSIANQGISHPSLITRGYDGNPANNPCSLIYTSEDGRIILFVSSATNLVEGYSGPHFLARLEEDATGNLQYRIYPVRLGNYSPVRAVISPSGRVLAAVVEEDGHPERNYRLLLFDLVRSVEVFNSQPTRYPISISAIDDEQVAFSDGSGLKVYNWETNAVWRPRNYQGRELRTAGELVPSFSGTCLRGDKLVFFAGDDGTPDGAWVAGDTNRIDDVFLYDASTGKILGVSYNASGPVPNNPVGAPQLGNTKAPLAFISGANNLVDGDTNNASDIFVWDGANPVFRPLDSASVQPTGNSESPNLSRNGRFLVFTARASNLPGGSATHSQVYFLDLQNPRMVEHISWLRGPHGEPTPANGDCGTPVVSSDGRYIVFASEASNLVQNGGRTDVPHVYLYDRNAPAAQRLRIISNPEDGGTNPVISSDGNWVYFVGLAGSSNESEILGYHIPTRNYLRRYPSGGVLQGNITQLAVNQDGTFVALVTDSALVANDMNGKFDVYVWQTDTGRIELVSKDSFGRIGNDDSFYPSISEDGRYVAFASAATNWVSGVVDKTPQVYVYDRLRGWLYTIKGTDLRPADAPCDSPEISGDGRYVAFQTNASNLTWDGDTTVSNIVVHEIGCVPPGDVNRDGIVDDADLLLVLFAFGSDDIRYDLNADSIIDDADLLIVLFNFGLTCTTWAGDLSSGNDPDLSDLFSGTSVLPSDVVNRDPFDWKSYMRQVAELDMLHQGKWPYPVAGLGSDSWVQLYGDPVGGTWYYDPPTRNEQGMFGDFFPASTTWRYSTGWKGFQAGNSKINVYGGGQVDLFATCQGGGSLSGTARGELGFNVFGMNLKVAEAYFHAGATNSTARLNAYFKVVGQTVWSKNESYNLVFVWPPGSSESNPVNIWNTSKSWSKRWTFYLGPVPIRITVSANASLGVKAHIKGSLAPVEAVAVVQPYVTSSVSAQGGVAFSFGCSASAGIGVNLSLLNDTLTAKGKAWLGVQNNRCCVFYQLSLHNQIQALNGSLYAYAEACCWGLNGPKCGWWRRRQQWNWTLFSWPGYSDSGYWFNHAGQHCF